MDTSNRQATTVPVSLIVLLLAGAGGVLLYRTSLKSARPPRPETGQSDVLGDEKIAARLWEDPFECVVRLKAANEAAQRSSGAATAVPTEHGEAADESVLTLRRRIAVACRFGTQAPEANGVPRHVIVLLAAVRAGRSAEDVERRIRARYAVVSGLGVAGFVPESTDRMGVIRLEDWPLSIRVSHPKPGEKAVIERASDQPDPGVMPLILPYEWYVENALGRPEEPGEATSVVVLWLPDAAFADWPVGRFAYLRQQLIEEEGAIIQDPSQAVSFRVLGPADSTSLMAMLADRPNDRLAEDTSRGIAAALREDFFGELRSFLGSPEEVSPEAEDPIRTLSEDRAFTDDLEARFQQRLDGLLVVDGAVAWTLYSHEWNEWLHRLGNDTQRALEVKVSDRELAPNVRNLLEDLPTKDFGDYWARTWHEALYRFLRDPEHASGMKKNEKGPSGTDPYEDIREIAQGIDVYSSWATAAPQLPLAVARGHSGAQEGSRDVQDRFMSQGVRFLSTVATDDRLAVALLDELVRRNIDPLDPRNHIVLVSEWDSFYGRALPLTFASALKNRAEGGSRPLEETIKDTVSAGEEAWPVNLHRIVYLRGVDGNASAPSSKDADSNQGKRESKRRSLTASKAESEDAVGTGQLDYMRRLAGRLADFDRQLKAEGKGRIRAIGVIGSDVYDKLLVLQALRPQHPGAIFFTTDLDERLAHTDQLDWTRNLIVASGFGLELSSGILPGKKAFSGLPEVPPFRTTYQTSLFFSTLLALNVVSDENLGQRLNPRIFEIGYNGPVDITPATLASFLNPPTSMAPPFGRVFFEVGALFAVGLLLTLPLTRVTQRQFFGGYVPGQTDDARRLERAVLLAFGLLMAVVAAAYAGLVRLNYSNGTGEPFSLIDGISVWPSEALRLLAAFLSVFFLLEAYFELDRSNRGLTGWFRLGTPSSAQEGKAGQATGFWRQVRVLARRQGKAENFVVAADHHIKAFIRAWKRNSIHWWAQPLRDRESRCGQPLRRVRSVWTSYLSRGRIGTSLWRFTPALIVYVAFTRGLILVFGQPSTPARGILATGVDKTCLTLSVALMLVLVFYVADATRLCQRFTDLLVPPTPSVLPELDDVLGTSDAPEETFTCREAIRLIGVRTRVVGRFILYPFLVLVVMVAARHPRLDNWDWPPALVLTIGLILLYALSCALVLRRAAEQARGRALTCLEVRGLGLRQAPIDADTRTRLAQEIEDDMKWIRNQQEGAFSPLSRHPVIAAISMPLGGVGILSLIEIINSW